MLDQVEALNKNIGQDNQFTRTFSNPICKQTYNSLPRIYGKKKKPKKIQLQTSNNNHSQKDLPYQKHYFSANEEVQQSRQRPKKTYSISNKLSTPKNHTNCKKKNCSCHTNFIQAKMDITTFNSKLKSSRKVVLPQIRKFDLQDLQTQHKVTRKNFYPPVSELSGLQKIILQQNKPTSSQNRNNEKFENGNLPESRYMKNMNHTKYKQKFKPIFNSKFEIQEESQEEKNTEELKNKKTPRENDESNSRRFVTEMNQSSDNGVSRDSLSLSSFVFKNSKRPNTNYHSLNKSQKTQEQKLSRSRARSILSNGLFRIPQQPQYKNYLKQYRPLNPTFTVKSLVKSQNFKILKQQKGVYFGDINQESQKHGTGLMVSQKQIFQGKFENNIKVIGFQRNIDGVYEGGFMNGLRSGNGKFKWNNGQTFQGNWEAGMKNGHGVWKSPKGDFYEGEWKNNRQNGQGVFKHRMSTYKGSFLNFLKHGYGEEIFANGDKYVGNYQHGKPHGKGRYQWNQGGFYQGTFVKGFRQGKGKWVDQNGTIYNGDFKKDSKDGYGTEVYKSGEKFQGQFSEGIRSNGILIDKEGRRIQIKGK